MSWRILYVEESDSISLYLDNVKVKRGTNEFTFPLNDISLVLIDNYKLVCTIGLFNACSTRNIPIVICGDNHHPYSILLPLHGHFESTKILFDQLSWTEDNKNKIWQILIKRKISNQLFVIENTTKDEDTITLLKKYIDEVEEGDPTNREGLAAKVYFRALFGKSFLRQEENVINACLNYGYSILRALISKTLVAKGLNTQLGIFHKGPGNGFNLSDDILEIFRPIIDLFVWQNFLDTKIFTKECRVKILTIINQKIEINNQKVTIYHAIEKIVDETIRFFKTGSLTNFVHFKPIIYDL